MENDIIAIRLLARAESAVKGTSLITIYLPSGGNL